MENLELLYSLFNQHVFQDAKNNIESLEYYFNTNPSTSGNPLVESLLEAIKNYSFDTIDVPLFQSILQRDRKTAREQDQILGEIMKWKHYNKAQMAPAKAYLRDICAGALIQRANNKFQGSAYEFYKYIKNSDLKVDNSDILYSEKFGDFDISKMEMDEQNQIGYPSTFSWINNLFEPGHRYESGQMVLVTMPPGCMAGETEVFLSDGTTDTLENLYKKQELNISVYSHDGSSSRVSVAENCQISKYVDSWYVVEIDGKQYRVTENHPFLMIDGSWKRADKLVIGDSLMPFNRKSTGEESYNHTITKVYIEQLETPQPVYDLVNVDTYHNYAVKLDENTGFFSHNTGKTLWMMTEALTMALTTKAKIHYLAMGDMKPRDFIIRMGAIYTGRPFGEVASNIKPIYETLKGLIEDRLEVTVIPAGQLMVDDYVDYIRSKNFDICFIDYDSNFKLKESESMYNDFGIVYNSLTKLTQDGRLVFIAAQPKINVWSNPVIELGDVGESARKIHTVDILFTAGKYIDSPNHVGIFKCCKNRRGEEGGRIGYIRLNNGRFKFIPIDLAKQLGAETTKKNYTEADIDILIRQYEETMSRFGSINDGLVGKTQSAAKINNPFKR